MRELHPYLGSSRTREGSGSPNDPGLLGRMLPIAYCAHSQGGSPFLSCFRGRRSLGLEWRFAQAIVIFLCQTIRIGY